MFPELCPEARQNPRVVRALEELTMRSRSDVEFERYEARRKFWMDINSAVRDTLFQGEKMGAIHLCERGLVIKRLQLRRAARHAKPDHALDLRGMMERIHDTVRLNIRRQQSGIQNRTQRQRAQPQSRLAKKSSPRLLLKLKLPQLFRRIHHSN